MLNYRVTCLATKPLTDKQHQELANLLNIHAPWRQLSGDDQPYGWAAQLVGANEYALNELQAKAWNFACANACDVNVVADTIASRYPRLAVFDMDSTLIQMECIDELAKRAGSGPEVSAITEAAMRGDIDFSASFIQRLSTVKGLERSEVDELVSNIPYTRGLDRLIAVLKAIGCRTVIASGGFTYFARVVAERYHFDRFEANELEWDGDQLTGKHIGGIVDGQRKADIVDEEIVAHQLPDVHTMAIGDGANDLLMMAAAGTGIAFHAKPVVLEQAPQRISQLGLDAVCYLLGLNDAQIDRCMKPGNQPI